MRRYREGQELALFLNNQKNSPAEVQMQRRLEGYMQYLAAEHKNLTIHDVDRHIFYGCDWLFEYHVIAQRFNAAITLQSRPLPDEIVHFAVFQVFHILLKQVVADQCIQLQILFLQVVRHLIHA